MNDLSIIIPARKEMFLKQTVEDALKNIEADTDIIALLDGAWTEPPLKQRGRVNLIYVNQAIGQRAGANLAVKLSNAKYVMKVDAHCAFDKGFDRKMLEAFEKTGDNVVMAPVMRNLHAFDWKCYHCGWKKYQGPTPKECPDCKKTDKIKRKMIWKPRRGTWNGAFLFDSEPHFQYFGKLKGTEKYKKEKKETGLTETMSLQGSCFMATREKYWELDLGGESLGNWGNQGLQIACATWLSGGRVLCNHKTWYAHMFRTQGGDFGFPWPAGGRAVAKTKKNVKDLFWKKGHPKQIYPVSWLVERFYPVPGWLEEELKRLKETEFKP